MVYTRTVDEKVVANLHAKLSRSDLSLPEKYRVLFSLRNCANASALPALILGLKDQSALFRHDVAFAIGQRQDKEAIDALVQVLDDAQENSMVRHEAAEALGAIGTEECLQPLKRHESDSMQEVAETCLLARQRVQFMAANENHESGSKYLSVDPTPPFDYKPANELHDILVDDKADLFDRYRALFSLRNAGGNAAVDSMAECMRTSGSALLKHQIAYVLGQMQDKEGVDCLKQVLRVRSPCASTCFRPLSVPQERQMGRMLQDEEEHPMVRHEAAEALAAIADESCVGILTEFANCEEPVVADSCIVALDVIAHERSGAFEYADAGEA